MRLKTTLFLFTTLLYFAQVEAQSCNADFEERNGLAVVELDSKTAGSWVRRNESGASGGRALYYNGGNFFNNPPGNSVLNYRVRVNSAGTYRVIIRNKIGIISSGPEPATSEHNDLWLRISGAEFYGLRDGRRVYPKGSGRTPNPEGASGNGYLKVYTNQLGWNWRTLTNDGPGYQIYVRFASAGVYNINIGGRSNGYFIDKLAMYKEGSVSASQAQNAAATPCSGGTPSNNAPSVTITSPSNGQDFNSGADITVRLNSSDSDGSVVQHEIFVNNNRVSNQGGTYTPYVLRNVNPANYAIRATVTDNDGAKSSSTVNITVGDATPPPPGNVAPTVTITSPSNGQNVAAGSNVSVQLNASDSDGSISRHQIFVNGTLVDTDGAGYTPHVIRNIAAGDYTIRATVTDNGGKTATSTVNISAGGGTPPPPPPGGNAAPTVSFTNLANGDQVNVGSTVFVGINANDSDGSVVKHQVFVNGLLVDTDGSNYTPHPIRNIAAGNYTIKVTVTDNDGATGSSTVTITAGSGTPPPPTNSDFSFNLINAASNSVIGPLVNGSSLSTTKTQNVNIRVNVPAGSGTKRVGVEVKRNGTTIREGFEFFWPYSVFGDTSGNYQGVTLQSGSYTMTVAAYTSTSDINSVVARTTINFTVGSSSGKSAFLYPNPVSTDGKVSVRLPEGASGKYEYSVTNSLGVQVEKGTFDAASSQRDVELSLPNIGRQVQGVYYMTLRSSGSKETIPLIRE